MKIWLKKYYQNYGTKKLRKRLENITNLTGINQKKQEGLL